MAVEPKLIWNREVLQLKETIQKFQDLLYIYGKHLELAEKELKLISGANYGQRGAGSNSSGNLISSGT